MDSLFDSVNGSTIRSVDGKPLKCAIKDGSSHIAFWHEAIKVLESMRFVNKTSGQTVKQPVCIKNWIQTLKSFKYLWLKLKAEGFKFLILRNLNQDSLECLFGSIRSHGVRNTMPNCIHFYNSFKTLLLNNFSSVKSLGNCEVDDNEKGLDNLKQFLLSNDSKIQHVPLDFDLSSFNIKFSNLETSLIGEMTIGYVSGYIIRAILKYTKFCEVCKNDCVDNNNHNKLIDARCYTQKSNLYKPSKNFNKIVEQILSVFTKTIGNICDKPSLFVKFDFLIDTNVDFNFCCTNHNLKQILKTKIINLFLFSWCKNINRILNGVDSRVESNPIKKMAREYFILHKTRGQGYNK